jgi:hypothetical protein
MQCGHSARGSLARRSDAALTVVCMLLRGELEFVFERYRRSVAPPKQEEVRTFAVDVRDDGVATALSCNPASCLPSCVRLCW